VRFEELLARAIAADDVPRTKQLIEQGADLNVEVALAGCALPATTPLLRTLRDADGEAAALKWWADRAAGSSACAPAFRPKGEMLLLLATAGADIHRVDTAGDTAIDTAVRQGDERAVRVLVALGAVSSIPALTRAVERAYSDTAWGLAEHTISSVIILETVEQDVFGVHLDIEARSGMDIERANPDAGGEWGGTGWPATSWCECGRI